MLCKRSANLPTKSGGVIMSAPRMVSLSRGERNQGKSQKSEEFQHASNWLKTRSCLSFIAALPFFFHTQKSLRLTFSQVLAPPLRRGTVLRWGFQYFNREIITSDQKWPRSDFVIKKRDFLYLAQLQLTPIPMEFIQSFVLYGLKLAWRLHHFCASGDLKPR